MQRAMEETGRRRAKQVTANERQGVTPRSIVKPVADVMEGARSAGSGSATGRAGSRQGRGATPVAVPKNLADLGREIRKLEERMYAAARNLEFEQAAALRDQVDTLRQLELELAGPRSEREPPQRA
jgi:excinuclease ABC subunit B